HVLRPPTEVGLDFTRAGDQYRRISRPPRQLLYRDWMPGDPAGRLHHLTHGEAYSVTQVVDHAIARIEALKGQQMRLRQVLYMNVVANARPIGRWIVLPENFDTRAPAQGYVKDERNEVRFRLMG